MTEWLSNKIQSYLSKTRSEGLASREVGFFNFKSMSQYSGIAKTQGVEPSLNKGNVQIFQNNEFGQVRTTVDENGEPLFCLSDLCQVLELDKSNTIKRLDDGVCSTLPILDSLNRVQNANFVNEDGLYDVILDSRKPSARKFRKWITSEVLPSIRKTGSYSVQKQLPQDYISALRALADAEEEKLKLESENAKMKPLVEYAEDVLTSNDCMTATEMAKELGFKSAMAFNRWCAENNILFYQSGRWLPYSKYSGIGWFATRTATYPKKDGTTGVKLYTVVTELGRKGLIELYKKLMNRIELL